MTESWLTPLYVLVLRVLANVFITPIVVGAKEVDNVFQELLLELVKVTLVLVDINMLVILVNSLTIFSINP